MNVDGEWPVRSATSAEIDALAKLWFEGWQDAHAEILPIELKKVRTLESFRERLIGALPDVLTAGQEGAPLGLAITKGDELYQLYVAAAARGTGIAARLVSNALLRIRANGHERAWLACAIGNERAARFYEKIGWNRQRVMTSQLPIAEGVFPLDVWRYEIALGES
jgi:GNAT superfamily N-acetyltransferase